MKLSKTIVFAALIAGAASVQIAWADSTPANCEVTRDGQKKDKQSGLCTFTESEGTITFELRDGKVIEITQGKKDNQFKDHKGQKVVREGVNKGKGQKYKWDHKKIVVTF